MKFIRNFSRYKELQKIYEYGPDYDLESGIKDLSYYEGATSSEVNKKQEETKPAENQPDTSKEDNSNKQNKNNKTSLPSQTKSTPVSSTTTVKSTTGKIKIYPGDNTYEYKVEGDHWHAARKGTGKWYEITGKNYKDKYQSTIDKLDTKFPDERKDGTPKRKISIAQASRNSSK